MTHSKCQYKKWACSLQILIWVISDLQIMLALVSNSPFLGRVESLMIRLWSALISLLTAETIFLESWHFSMVSFWQEASPSMQSILLRLTESILTLNFSLSLTVALQTILSQIVTANFATVNVKWGITGMDSICASLVMQIAWHVQWMRPIARAAKVHGCYRMVMCAVAMIKVTSWIQLMGQFLVFCVQV